MYYICLSIILCLSYFLVLFFFNTFFVGKANVTTEFKPIRSMVLILLFCFLIFTMISKIYDPELHNRVLHMLGGAFISYLACFLVVEDRNIKINKIQFFIFSALVVTTLGVGNELLEFFLQHYTHLVFSNDSLDTWLDLASNTAGIFIAALVFTPFINKEEKI